MWTEKDKALLAVGIACLSLNTGILCILVGILIQTIRG